MAFVMRMMLARVPDFDRWERDRGHSMLNAPVRATDSKEWLVNAEQQKLNLLPTSIQHPDLKLVLHNTV